MNTKNGPPKLIISPASPKHKRLSIEESMINNMRSNKKNFQMLSPFISSPDVSRIRTESTPSNIFSVSDFWKQKQPITPRNLTFTKPRQNQDVVNRYMSKVLINVQTNISQAFKKLIRPSAYHLKDKRNKRENKWFKVTANIISLNSKINEQKALWRLKGISQSPEKSTYQKYIDMVIYPQQYISLEPKLRALLSLEQIIKANQIHKIVIHFKNNLGQYQTKQRSLMRIKHSLLESIRMVLLKFRCLPKINKFKRYFRIKQKLIGYIDSQRTKKVRYTFQIFKAQSVKGNTMKIGSVSQISKNWYRNTDKSFAKWLSFSKLKAEKIRMERVKRVFEIAQEREKCSFESIFKGFDPNISKKIRDKLNRLIQIQDGFKNHHMKKALKKWKKKDNQWYRRAARIMALNTTINQQTGLWRLQHIIVRS